MAPVRCRRCFGGGAAAGMLRTIGLPSSRAPGERQEAGSRNCSTTIDDVGGGILDQNFGKSSGRSPPRCRSTLLKENGTSCLSAAWITVAMAPLCDTMPMARRPAMGAGLSTVLNVSGTLSAIDEARQFGPSTAAARASDAREFVLLGAAVGAGSAKPAEKPQRCRRCAPRSPSWLRARRGAGLRVPRSRRRRAVGVDFNRPPVDLRAIGIDQMVAGEAEALRLANTAAERTGRRQAPTM